MRRNMGLGFTCCIAVALAVAGCQSEGAPCVSMDAPDPTFARAAVTRVEIYGAGAACSGSGIAPGAGAPILSRVFAAGEEITLNAPEGQAIVLFQGFADAPMTTLIGSNCSTVNVSPGSGLCLSLHLVPVVTSGCSGPADCDRGHYCEAGLCVAGCAAADDCTAGSLCCDHHCVNPAGDPQHCGGCGHACQGAATLCCAGVCFDGASDVYHCGSCERSCLAYRGMAACLAGACIWKCDPGFTHCGGALNSGCETSLTTPTDCGSCGTTCDGARSVDATCDGASCHYRTCRPGWADCDPTPPDTDGCETDIATTTNCGGCGMACDSTNSMGATCADGTCSYASCRSGFGNCRRQAPDLDGCETPLTTTSDCGDCGVACRPENAQTASCDGRSCSYICDAGYADCQSAPPNTDGCETLITTIANCGGCARACDVKFSQGARCSGGACVYSGCQPGRLNCDQAAPDTNGCECATPGCCMGKCQTTHDNGLGQTWFDCLPLGTYTYAQATAACRAFVGMGNWNQCQDYRCKANTSAVCSSGAQACACWTYIGGSTGQVLLSMKGDGCACASGKSPLWQ